MRYLPTEGSHHWDRLWSSLVDKIKDLLEDESVLRTRDRGELRPISELRRRLPVHNDQFGAPLLQDSYPELYLSDKYQNSDIDVLEEFGLSTLMRLEIVELAKRDLARSDSRIRNSSMTSDWHGRVSRLLSIPWTLKNKELGNRSRAATRKLHLIPLINGSWAAATKEIMWADINGIPIPRDLGLRLVCPDAKESDERKRLFDYLGVQSASAQVVRGLVFDKYRRNKATIDIAMSKEHLRFLYLTDIPTAKLSKAEKDVLAVFDSMGAMVIPSLSVVYKEDNQPYGAYQLLGIIGAVLARVSFLNSAYLDDPPEKPSGRTLSWTKWLHDVLGIRRHVRLYDSSSKSLSEEFQYIKKHRRDMLLGYLKHVWPIEGDLVKSDEKALGILRHTDIPSLNEDNEVSPCEASLPLQELRRVCKRFTGGDKAYFLSLPDLVDEIDDAELLVSWGFLAVDLGIGFRDDLDFRLNLITILQDSSDKTPAPEISLRAASLYQYIEAACVASEDPSSARSRVE